MDEKKELKEELMEKVSGGKGYSCYMYCSECKKVTLHSLDGACHICDNKEDN